MEDKQTIDPSDISCIPTILEEIKEFEHYIYSIEHVFLIGSRLYQTHEENSDFDYIVVISRYRPKEKELLIKKYNVNLHIISAEVCVHF